MFQGKEKQANPQSPQISTEGESSSTNRTLWCLIDGDSTPFPVTVPTTGDVSDMKRHIWEEGINPKTDILAKDITLWKVLDLPVDLLHKCWS